MKIALIQTPWSDASHRVYKGIARRYALYPPLGLMCLAAAAENAGHEADVIDIEIEDIPFPKLVQYLKDTKVDIIGITATSPVFHIAEAFAEGLRKEVGVPIVIGGPHINVLHEKAFSKAFDYAVIQEGEETLVELLDTLEAKENPSSVNGLMYRENEEIIRTAPRKFKTKLDEFPRPARSKVDPNNYIFEVPGKGVIPVGTIELTRGCPFLCVFCSEPSNTGRAVRRRSVESVVTEMIDLKGEFGIDHFFFLDSTLTLNRQLIEDLCHEIIRRNANVTWEGQTRANLIDEELTILMKKAGLVRVFFGVESADPEVLRLMKKEVEPKEMREAFRIVKKHGITTMRGHIIGNPGDTRATVLKTAKFVRSIPEVKYVVVGVAIPYPGTELYEMAEKGMHGLKLLSKDFSKYSRYNGGVMEVDGMTPKDLIRLQRLALIISNSTINKFIGLVSHFGFWSIIKAGLHMLQREIMVRSGKSEPTMNASIADSNTTLKSLGATYDSNKQLSLVDQISAPLDH